MAAEAAIAPFRQGLKEVYLPKFSIALIHTPRQPPFFASFAVPLWFNKLDLRDYLYNAYNVRILNVRSYIKLQRITQGKPTYVRGETYERPQMRRWHRPQSEKRMTVELERPFVWPEAPSAKEDLEQFGKKQQNLAVEDQKEFQKANNPVEAATMTNEERRKAMREQAKALLEGRAKWKPVAEKGFGT